RDRAPEPVDIGRSRIGPSTDGLRESRREQGPIGPAQLRPSSGGAGRGGFQELSPPAVRARWRRNRAAQLSRGAARLGRYGCRRSGNAVSAGVSRPPRRSNFEVGLLTTLPALGGLLFAIPFGQVIQRRRNVVPWYSRSRLI